MNKTILAFILMITLTASQKKDIRELSSNNIKIEYNSLLHSKIINLNNSNELMNDFSPSEYIIVDGDILKNFNYENSEIIKTDSSRMLKISGISNSNKFKIRKTILAENISDFQNFILTKITYTNLSAQRITINEWVNNNYSIGTNGETEIPFWSYQSGTYPERPDWVLPIKEGFSQQNFMGMNASDYGGGTPVVDVWRKDVGIAIGHVEPTPKLVSLPVEMKSKSKVNIKLVQKQEIALEPGESFQTYTTFVGIHNGDYFKTLSDYSKLMQKRGFNFREIPEESYEPIWCAWGYERNFKVEQVLNTLPKVKELGYEWAVLDDGWQTAEGDWFLNPEKFPNGDSDMKAFVDSIHSIGLKAKLWWTPLAVDPGTELFKNHEDWILLNENGKPQDITWWDSYYLCPAYKPVLEYTKEMVEKFLGEWRFDGLKIDGQHLNGTASCYNPKHKHDYPEQSVEGMVNFYKIIYETALNINPKAVVEICPCGTAYSYYMLPYVNQVVSSDPTSSWQIRLKGKTFKALIGPQAPYYGDHVELSDNKNDFASTVGIGGIVGTKFTWPVGAHKNKETGDVSLTSEKEIEWKKWVNIYKENMLSKGNYLGELYDIGFDKPETHVIKKDGAMFYSFYADEFAGEIELRGLDKNEDYEVTNYIDKKIIAQLPKGTSSIKVNFKKFLLIKVNKKNNHIRRLI
jgi:alpha-galactosidase